MRRMRHSVVALAIVAVTALGAVTGAVASAPAASAATGCTELGGATSNGTTVEVTGSVTCTSSSGGAGGGFPASVPPCWLAPRYTGKALWDNFHGNVDNIGFLAIPKPGQAYKYRKTPASVGVWWVPVSNGTAAGNACAYALYWPVFGPPPQPGATIPGFPVMSQTQAGALALKSLKLPTINVALNPTTNTYVNLPTWVHTNHYKDPVSVTATIRIPVIGMGYTFTVSATITATEQGGLRLSMDAPGSITDRGCGLYGSDSQSGGLTCGMVFTAPTGATGYPVTAQTTWKVTGPGVNVTRTDKSDVVDATVSEIQSANG